MHAYVSVVAALRQSVQECEPLHLPACWCSASALKLWADWNGALDWIQKLVGDIRLQAMISESSAFQGDFASREFVDVPVIELVRQWKIDSAGHVSLQVPRTHLYLAQVPLTGELAPLSQHLSPPAAMSTLKIASRNMWMNRHACSSSIHYDPHHNVLCVVRGVKTVKLWPPSCGLAMSPFHALGESANHSSIKLGDKQSTERATAAAGNRYLSVALAAGDILFIPIGWWHQVDSAPCTIAVNFWCHASRLPVAAPHMTFFIARQTAQRAVADTKTAVLSALQACAANLSEACPNHSRLICSAQLLSEHWISCAASVRRDTSSQGHDSNTCIGTGSRAQQHRNGVREACQDALALSLLTCSSMIWLLCTLSRWNPVAMRTWLLEGMSVVCAEVFTGKLEGSMSFDSHAAAAVPANIDETFGFSSVPVPMPSSAAVDAVRKAEAESPEAPASFGMDDLFRDVYALDTKGVLLKFLMHRKVAFSQQCLEMTLGFGVL